MDSLDDDHEEQQLPAHLLDSPDDHEEQPIDRQAYEDLREALDGKNKLVSHLEKELKQAKEDLEAMRDAWTKEVTKLAQVLFLKVESQRLGQIFLTLRLIHFFHQLIF